MIRTPVGFKVNPSIWEKVHKAADKSGTKLYLWVEAALKAALESKPKPQ